MPGKNASKTKAVSSATPTVAANVAKYARGNLNFSTSGVKHKHLRKTLEETRERIQDAASITAAAEVLLPADDGFIQPEKDVKVFKFKQKEILQHVDMNTAKNAFDLQLTNFGPYNVDYTRNGRFMLFAGKRGHVAMFDNLRTNVGMELQLQQEIHDVKYLQNETMFAAAQEKYTYIYDNKGVEIHCMKRHERPYKLEFLPYHYLLTSVGHSGWIKWHDVSVGEYVAGYQTGHGPCRVLKQNKSNAVCHVGHSNGVVSLWSPNAGKSLVSMFCHKSPITDLAVDREGNYMATAGLDGYMKVWDLRKFTPLHSYKIDHPAMSLDVSDKGLIGMAVGRTMQILRNAFTQPMDVTYLSHEVRTPNAALCSGGGATASKKALLSNVSANCVRFRPLEDVACIGHSHGITTIIVPGAGEANYDSFENNPFANVRQRREAEVQSLLNKLSSDMIGLDSSFIGSVEPDRATLQAEQKSLFESANQKELAKREKNRARGRNKISAKLRRKQKNVVDAQQIKLKEMQKAEREAREAQKAEKNGLEPAQKAGGKMIRALSRFAQNSDK